MPDIIIKATDEQIAILEHDVPSAQVWLQEAFEGRVNHSGKNRDEDELRRRRTNEPYRNRRHRDRLHDLSVAIRHIARKPLTQAREERERLRDDIGLAAELGKTAKERLAMRTAMDELEAKIDGMQGRIEAADRHVAALDGMTEAELAALDPAQLDYGG